MLTLTMFGFLGLGIWMLLAILTSDLTGNTRETNRLLASIALILVAITFAILGAFL